MHAYLLIGNNLKEIDNEVSGLTDKLKAKVLEFPLQKVEQVRELNNFLKLSVSGPTLIVARDIHNSTTEALNAFLKNLEEPGRDVFFALTSTGTRNVLSTIVSRCQIIKIGNVDENTDDNAAIEFINKNAAQKLLFFDKMKDRDASIKFIESVIFFLHKKRDLNNMEILIKTLTGLKANGNVNLHLTNLAIQFKT